MLWSLIKVDRARIKHKGIYSSIDLRERLRDLCLGDPFLVYTVTSMLLRKYVVSSLGSINTVCAQTVNIE